MILHCLLPLTLALSAGSLSLTAAEAGRNPDTVVLDEAGVKNLRIQTATTEEAVFEDTVFALGRIEVRPGKTAAVASRISGRVAWLGAFPGDRVSAGDEVVKVESRQPGNPPPTISLTAPLDGIVSHLETRLGDPVDPDKPLLEIVDLSEVHAIARVPESIAGGLAPGARAHITVPAAPDANFEGELVRFGTTADTATGTIDAVFTLNNSKGLLRPGMRAEFSIVLSRREGVVSVPRSALQGDAANRYVFVKDFELPNAFVKAPVVVGQMNERRVEILAGLFPADEVVTQGAYSLAFAGGGSMSLKDALDAAHGHEHAADGSELGTASAKNSHDHNDADSDAGSSTVWMIVSGVLFILLVLVSIQKRTGEDREAQKAAK